MALVCGEATPGLDHVMVRLDDVDAVRDRARQLSVEAGEPADHLYDKRQVSRVDLVGRTWPFSQSIAAVDATAWGARTTFDPANPS